MYICLDNGESTVLLYGNRVVLSKGTGIDESILNNHFRKKDKNGKRISEFKNDRFWIIRAELITSKRK